MDIKWINLWWNCLIEQSTHNRSIVDEQTSSIKIYNPSLEQIFDRALETREDNGKKRVREREKEWERKIEREEKRERKRER